MTKKDFIAIAKVLDANVAPLELVQDFADMLVETNERFDRTLFIRASTLRLLDMTYHTSSTVREAHGL